MIASRVSVNNTVRYHIMRGSSLCCILSGLWAENVVKMSRSCLNYLLWNWLHVLDADIAYDKATFVLSVFHCEQLSLQKGFHNKNHSLGPLVIAMTEQTDTFMRHLLILGGNGSLHSVASKGGWMWWICIEIIAHSNDVQGINISITKGQCCKMLTSHRSDL